MPNDTPTGDTGGTKVKSISISILDLDIRDIKASLDELRAIGVTSIHVDIIDTSFADNISFGVSTLNYILEQPGFAFFIHVMVQDPTKVLRRLKYPGGTRVAVHSQAAEAGDMHVSADELREVYGAVPVLAISPNEEVSDLDGPIRGFQEVLVMTVKPGLGGQELIEGCIRKIGECKRLGKRVTVDGGVTVENIRRVAEADVIVVGSAFTTAEDKTAAFKALLNN